MRRKRLLIIPAVLVLALVALFLGLRAAFPPERLLALAEPRLEAALGRPVEIGSARLDLMPLAARLEAVRIGARPGFASPHVVELDAMQLELGFLALLRRQLEVRSLVLDGLRLFLEQDEQGQWNFATDRAPGTPSAPAAPAKAGTPMALQIRKLLLRDGALQLRSAQSGLELQGPLAAELAMGLDRNLHDLRLQGWIESPALRARGPLGEFPALTVRLEPVLRADLGASSAHIDSLRLRLQDFVLQLEGEAALHDRKPELHLRTRSQEFELAEILELLPKERLPRLAGVEASGRARIDLRLDAPGTGKPHLEGDLALAGGRLQSREWPASISDLELTAKLHGDSLQIQHLEARIGEAPLSLQGEIVSLFAPENAAYSVQLRTRLDLATLAAVAATFAPKPPPYRLEGTLQADARLEGRLAGKSLPSLHGPLALEGVRIQTPQLRQPLELQARLVGAGATIQVEKLNLACGEARLAGSGTVQPALPPKRPRIALRGRAAALDLDALLPATATGTDTAAATRGKGTGSAKTLLPPLPPLDLELDLEAGVVQAQRTALRDAHLQWKSEAQDLHLTLRAARLERDNFLLEDCQAELAGTPARARGHLQAKSGRLNKIRAAALQSDLHLDGTTLELPNLTAQTYDGKLGGSMKVDLATPAAPRQELVVEMDKVQLGGLLEDFFRAGSLVEGTLDGTSSWNVTGAGAAAMRQQLTGKGQGLAVNGRFKELPILKQLGAVLGLPSLSNLSYRQVGFSFAVESGQVKLPSLKLQGNDADATVEGKIGLDGGLDLAFGVQLSSALTQQALRAPATRGLGSLFTDSAGRLVLDFDIDGTLRAPKVRPDLQATARRTGLRALGAQQIQRLLGNVATEEAKKKLGRSLQEAVKGILPPPPAPAPTPPDTTRKP